MARTPFEQLKLLQALSPERQRALQALREGLNPLALKRKLDARLERRVVVTAGLLTAAD